MEKKKYRFVGTETMLGERRLSRLGDVVELTDEEAKSVLGETGAPLVSEAVFEAAGFTAEELKRFATFAARVSAPEEFNAKLLKAQTGADAKKGWVKS